MPASFNRAMRVIAAMSLMVACAQTGPPGDPTSSAPGPTATASPPPSTSTTTTTTTTPVETDLVNPVAGTLSGVAVDSPAGAVLETLGTAYGPADEDTGWIADECLGLPRVRYVAWDRLNVYLSEDDGGTVWLNGYTVEDHSAASPPSEKIELPEGITLGMSYADAVTLYPDGAYRHESLELDGIVFEAAHFLAAIGQASDDGSAPLTQVWVGSIPVCA